MKHLALGTILFTVALAACAPESTESSGEALAAEIAGPTAEPESVTMCPRGPTTRGLDVSYHQGFIDWPVVARAGVVFAFARVSDGAGFLDPRFGENWSGMKAAGVMRGSYQFFRPTQDPRAQAAVLIREITARGGLGPGDLPPALDIEVTDGVDGDTLKSRALVWLRTVESALGRTPVIYTSPGFWEDLGADHAFDRYSLWVAHWDARCPRVPDAWERWRFWQDASRGSVPGITGAVDTDWFHGTRADLEVFAHGRAHPQRALPAPKALPAPRALPAPKAAPAPRAKAPVPAARRPRSAPRALTIGDVLRILNL